MHENKFAPRVGLDMITLNHVLLRKVTDWDKLKACNERGGKNEFCPVTYPYKAYRMESGQRIGRIVITEEGSNAKFWEIRFGNKYGPYGDIRISPRNIFGENLHNMSVSVLQSYLLYLTDYLAENYGILVDFTYAEFKTMEINVTFPLIDKYDNYKRAIRAIIYNVPWKNKLGENNEKVERFVKNYYAYAGSKTFEVKIYDKIHKMHKDKEPIPEDVLPEMSYMRIEFSLLTKELIQRRFGTAELGSITQDEVVNVYMYLFNTRIKSAEKIWDYERKPELRSKVKEAYSKRFEHGGQWIKDLLITLLSDEVFNPNPLILSGEDLEKEIKNLPIGNNNMSRTLKGFRKSNKGILEINGRYQIAEIYEAVENAYKEWT